jgi:hypothetical protein
MNCVIQMISQLDSRSKKRVTDEWTKMSCVPPAYSSLSSGTGLSDSSKGAFELKWNLSQPLPPFFKMTSPFAKRFLDSDHVNQAYSKRDKNEMNGDSLPAFSNEYLVRAFIFSVVLWMKIYMFLELKSKN